MKSRILIMLGSATLLALLLAMIPTTRHTTEEHYSRIPMPPLPPPPDKRTGLATAPLLDFGIQAIGNPIPTKGDQKLLIILADFTDKPGMFTGQAWRQFFWGAGGFADYFTEVSYNQLRYTTAGDVVGMSGGVPVTNSTGVAYVRMPNPITYYADGYFGFKVGPGQFPRNNAGVVYHALQALDTAGFDFSPYANPTTKVVENLAVIFAGRSYGYTRDPSNSLEATAYSLTDAGGSQYTSQGGQTFNNYTFCPEQTNYPGYPDQIARIGICMHEHGHALGIPDLYDLSYTTSGVGNFDSMGYGLYGASEGARPFHLSVFSKEFAGWITPTALLSGTSVITLGPAESGTDLIKLYPFGDPNFREYFLLENRQPLGFDQDWQSASLCAGLVIWHVDQNIVEDYASSDYVNTLPSAGGPPHQGVIVVEADGRFDMIKPPMNYGECSDTWTVGRTWNDTSTPDSRLWGGANSLLSVTVLSAENGSVTLGITAKAGTLKTFLPVIRKQS